MKAFRLTLIHPCIGRRPGEAYIKTWQMESLPMGVLAGLTPTDVDVRMYDDRMELIPYDEPTDLVAISVETYTAMTFGVETGKRISRNELLANLVALQYRRNDTNFIRGAFRVRGDTVELFPAHLEDRAWRISLFGDELEAVWEIDSLTGDKIAETIPGYDASEKHAA